MDGTSSNMNKGRLGKRITTRTQENIEALPYASIGKKIKEE